MTFKKIADTPALLPAGHMTFKKFADTPVLLFALPLFIGVISFMVMRLTSVWQVATVFGVCLVVSVLVLLFSGLFVLHNGLLLNWRMNWWKNLFLTGAFYIVGVLLLTLLLRVDITTDMPSYADALAQKLLLPSTPTPPSVLPCVVASDCMLPMAYAVQSNCPFSAVCAEGSCVVACPLYTPGVIGEGGYSLSCNADRDCACGERGDRTLSCQCVNNICYSIEDYITESI